MKKFLILGILALAACGNSDDKTAELRVVHASPDAPAVDVLVNNTRVLEGVAYQAASSYLPVDTGAQRIRVNAAGTDTTVIDVTPTLDKDVAYTAFAIDRLSSIEPLLTVDERDSAPKGNVNIRVIHGAPSAPAVDVYVTSPDADLSSAEPVLKNVPFRAVSDYLQVPAGEYRARVTAAGKKQAVIDSGALELTSGLTATVIALDAPGSGSPFSLKVLKDNQ